jgi:hypothetical protein
MVATADCRPSWGRITTNLSHYLGGDSSVSASFGPNSSTASWKTAEQGAATSVLLTSFLLPDGVTDRYLAT